MSTLKKFVYFQNGIITSIDVKPSQNSKLGFGYVVQTYHFSTEQVFNNNIKLDTKNCLNCPLSFSNKGGCYTHKGHQFFGLKSKLRSLHKMFIAGKINEFNIDDFNKFIDLVRHIPISLVRFGSYGEPSLMDIETIKELSKLGLKSVGYTHSWNLIDNEYAHFLMASTHNQKSTKKANNKGWFAFELNGKDGVNCPASKESKNKLTCIECGICDGKTTNVYINKH